MKKNGVLIISIIVILIIIIICIAIHKPKEKELVETIELKDIFDGINSASNDNFRIIQEYDAYKKLPIGFSTSYENLVFAVDITDENKYFFIAYNLDKPQKEKIESFYSEFNDEENAIFYIDEEYVYFINHDEYLYVIDGIIKSFINNY